MKHNALNKGLAELVTREFDSRSSFPFLFVIRHARDAPFNLISLPLLFPSLEKFYTFPHEQNLYNDINLNIEATHSCPSSIDSSSSDHLNLTVIVQTMFLDFDDRVRRYPAAYHHIFRPYSPRIHDHHGVIAEILTPAAEPLLGAV